MFLLIAVIQQSVTSNEVKKESEGKQSVKTERQFINRKNLTTFVLLMYLMICLPTVCAAQSFTYKNTLTKIGKPLPILADFPEFVEPLLFDERFLAPPVVYEEHGEIEVRSWRYWYNARGIIEMTNRLDADATAIINLLAWGVDDGGGLQSPEPAGTVLSGTPKKNALFPRQVRQVINPFLDRMGSHTVLIGHTLPGKEDPVRRLLYPSLSNGGKTPDEEKGRRMLRSVLTSHTFTGPKPEEIISLDNDIPLTSYLLEMPSSHANTSYSGSGYNELPVPLVKGLVRTANEIVFYEGDGYDTIRDYLKSRGIRHILVLGFFEKETILPTHPRAEDKTANTSVTAGFGSECTIETLGKDFNIFLVGDAMRTTFPASDTPRFAVQAELAKLSGEYMVTQVGWVTVVK